MSRMLKQNVLEATASVSWQPAYGLYRRRRFPLRSAYFFQCKVSGGYTQVLA